MADNGKAAKHLYHRAYCICRDAVDVLMINSVAAIEHYLFNADLNKRSYLFGSVKDIFTLCEAAKGSCQSVAAYV